MRVRNTATGWVMAALLAVTALSSCAYYNTYYLARKYYDRGTNGEPYVVEKPDGSAVANFTKSIDYSKKLLASYPKSKWVDDAYLLWARSLIGKDDPIQTVNMLKDFPTRYPQSSLKNEAVFYMGVGNRKARKYTDALGALDEFLKISPKHRLAPYALLERSRVMMSLDRPEDAASSAAEVLERFPKSGLADYALLLRGDASFALGDYEGARQDYHVLGGWAVTDEQRFGYLLKEAECLEGAHRYDDELALLLDAASHEQAPARSAPTTVQQGITPVTPSNERWGRLMVRVGTVHMLAGRTERALEVFRRVVDGFPRTALAAEGQFRIAYTYETAGDDFERARVEYAKVQAQSANSQFATQATMRLAALDRLAQYRSGSGPDSVGKKAEAGFLLAEQYLFQLDKPDRALEQYRSIARDYVGTPYAPKALNAEAWMMRNVYKADAAADSILWWVVNNYPKTEAQMNARDYLERYGHVVPEELIEPPDPPPVVARDTLTLTPPPAHVDSLGVHKRPAAFDSLMRFGVIRAGETPPKNLGMPPGTMHPAPADTQRVINVDSLHVEPTGRDSLGRHE